MWPRSQSEVVLRAATVLTPPKRRTQRRWTAGTQRRWNELCVRSSWTLFCVWCTPPNRTAFVRCHVTISWFVFCFFFFIVLNLFANRSMNQFPTACHLSHTSRASRKEKTGNRLRILFDDKRRRKILKFISRRVRLRFSTEKKLNSSSTKHTIRH